MIKKWLKNNILLALGIPFTVVVLCLSIAIPLVINSENSNTSNKVNDAKQDIGKNEGSQQQNEKEEQISNNLCKTKPISADDFIKCSADFAINTPWNTEPKQIYVNNKKPSDIHDADTFRGVYTTDSGGQNPKNINPNGGSVRIIGYDAPEVNGQDVPVKKADAFGSNESTKYQVFFGRRATYKVREILANKEKYNIFYSPIAATTHDRALGAIFVDLKATKKREYYSLASIIVRMGLAIPGRPNSRESKTHFHIHKHYPGYNSDTASKIEERFGRDLKKNLILAFKEKQGFFNTENWLASIQPKKIWEEPKKWTTKAKWIESITSRIYPGINWWKNEGRTVKYCTLDTFDTDICDNNE